MLFLFFGQFGNEHLVNLIALQNELLFTISALSRSGVPMSRQNSSLSSAFT